MTDQGILIGIDYNGVRYYYVTNALGDVRYIINTSGAIMVTYVYDSWGKVLSTSGSLASTVGANNPIRYRGYYYDTETGLYSVGLRYYDPEVGRWISPDDASVALGAGEYNLYAYCMNDPVNNTDSTGMSPFFDKVGQWFKDHKTELIIGAVFIVAGVLTMGAAAAIGGATLAGVMAAMGTAAVSSLTQVGISMAISAGIGAAVGGITGGWEGALQGFGDGLASGFMWGGIFAGTAQMLSGAMSITRSLAPSFNGKIMGNVKIWSPNNAGNPNIGGTLVKFGKYNRFDVEAGRGLHMAWIMFGSKINHIPLGIILGGGIGGFGGWY